MAIKQGEQLQEIRLNLASLSERVDLFEQGVSGRFETQQRIIESVEQSINNRLDTFEQSLNNRFETQDKKLDQIMGMLATLTHKLELGA